MGLYIEEIDGGFSLVDQEVTDVSLQQGSKFLYEWPKSDIIIGGRHGY